MLMVHFLVPCFIHFNGWSWIYSDAFNFDVIFWTSLTIIISFIPFRFLRFQRLEIMFMRVRDPYLSMYGLILFGYIIIYFIAGGLSYRYFEAQGVNRSVILNFVLSLSPAMLVLSIYLILSKKIFSKLSALIFVAVLVVSGGRGFLIQFIIVLFLFLRLLKNQSKNEFRLLRIRDFGLFSIILFFFGYFGLIRDGGSDILFSSFLRFSEPYWYLAWENSSPGFNNEMFHDILERLIWSISRLNLFNTPGNIDGNTFYLPEYLNITLPPGVSLPITLTGQGYLLFGTLGVCILLLLGISISVFGLKLIRSWGILNTQMVNIYILYYISKMFNFHAKSISGLMSYLLYETIRDLVILTLLQLSLHLLFKRYVFSRLISKREI